MLLGGARRVAEIEIVPVTPKHAAVARPAPCAARRIPPIEGYRRCGRLPEALHTRVGKHPRVIHGHLRSSQNIERSQHTRLSLINHRICRESRVLLNDVPHADGLRDEPHVSALLPGHHGSVLAWSSSVRSSRSWS